MNWQQQRQTPNIWGQYNPTYAQQTQVHELYRTLNKPEDAENESGLGTSMLAPMAMLATSFVPKLFNRGSQPAPKPQSVVKPPVPSPKTPATMVSNSGTVKQGRQ